MYLSGFNQLAYPLRRKHDDELTFKEHHKHLLAKLQALGALAGIDGYALNGIEMVFYFIKRIAQNTLLCSSHNDGCRNIRPPPRDHQNRRGHKILLW